MVSEGLLDGNPRQQSSYIRVSIPERAQIYVPARPGESEVRNAQIVWCRVEPCTRVGHQEKGRGNSQPRRCKSYHGRGYGHRERSIRAISRAHGHRSTCDPTNRGRGHSVVQGREPISAHYEASEQRRHIFPIRHSQNNLRALRPDPLIRALGLLYASTYKPMPADTRKSLQIRRSQDRIRPPIVWIQLHAWKCARLVLSTLRPCASSS